jgi:2-oxoglutarate ferredoxin oxidoreductase subunit beta
MLQYFKENTVKVGSRRLEEAADIIPRGVFVEESRPEYCDEYAQVIARAQATSGGGDEA